MFTGTTTLFVNHYSSTNQSRRAELDRCLRENLANPHIDQVVLIAQSDPAHREQVGTHPKIVWHELPDQRRPSFQLFFDLINRFTTSPYDLNILANSDIFFDRSLALIKDRDLQGTCVALTRWELRKDGRLERRWGSNSQDAWMFQGRVRPTDACEFPMGIFGCDNKLAWILKHADYRLVNPCLTVFATHLHHSGVRNNGRCLPGPYDTVKCMTLSECGLGVRTEVKAGVIGFSLFGSAAIYSAGAIENAKLARWIYSGWVCRYYVDDTVPEPVVAQLRALKAEVVPMPRSQRKEGMFWRFLVADEVGFARWMVRDLDSRLNYRERRAVDEWVASGAPFHVMRDHPWHTVNRKRVIMGLGFGGTRGSIPPLGAAIEEWRRRKRPWGPYGADEQFLAEIVWPHVKASALVHDGTAVEPTAAARPFPSQLEHWRYVGEKIHQDEHCIHGHRDARSWQHCRDPRRKRVAFGCTVYREGAERLAAFLSNLREFHPTAQVIVFADGADLSGYREACETHRATYVSGKRLKVLAQGARWWGRLLGGLLETDADYLFKVDPDARFHRPFRSFPAFDVFGTQEPDHIQGGIQGFGRDAAARIVASGLCEDPVFADPKTWARARHVKQYVAHRGQISTDYTLAEIVRRLDLTTGDWAEVDSQYRRTRPARTDAAVTHPHK